MFVACVASRKLSRDESFMKELKSLNDYYYGSNYVNNNDPHYFTDYEADCDLANDQCDANHIDEYGNKNPRLKCQMNARKGKPICDIIYGDPTHYEDELFHSNELSHYYEDKDEYDNKNLFRWDNRVDENANKNLFRWDNRVDKNANNKNLFRW